MEIVLIISLYYEVIGRSCNKVMVKWYGYYVKNIRFDILGS